MHDMMVSALNSENFELAIKNLSYEDRKSIITSNLFVANLIKEKIIGNKIKIFNQEEAIKFFYNYRDVFNVQNLESIIFLLAILPDEILINELLEHLVLGVYNKNFYIIVDLVKNPLLLLEKFDRFNSQQKEHVFKLISDDELEKLMFQKKYKNYIEDIIFAFKTDEYKRKYLNKLNGKNKSLLIASLSDENKKQYIKPFTFHKGNIISRINDDSLKERYLQIYKVILTEEEKVLIISSFKDLSYIKRNLKYLKGEKSYLMFLNNASKLNQSEIYKEILLSLKNEKNIYDYMINNTEVFSNFELAKKLLLKINSNEYLYKIIHYSCSVYFYQYILPRLSQKYIVMYVKENMEYLYDYHILLYLNDDNLLIEVLEHFEIKADFNEDMMPLFEKIATKYNLNLNHLLKLVKIAGCSIIRQIKNENIYNAINLDEESFKKYLQIFDKNNINTDKNALYSILNSLLNKRFSIENPNEVQIFIDTLHAVADGNIDLAINKMRIVLSNVDLSDLNIVPLNIIKGVIDGDEEIIRLYNKITYLYLTQKRNKYVNDNIDAELSKTMNIVYDTNDLVKYVLKVMPVSMLIEYIESSISLFKDEEKELVNNKELLMALINFKKNPSSGINLEYKKYLKLFNNMLKNMFDDYYCDEFLIDGVKKIYKDTPYNKSNLVEIMMNIDTLKIQNLIFSNKELFDELLRYLDRYDVLGWASRFDKISNQYDVEMDSNIISSLISNFELIMKSKKEKEKKGERFTLISELALAACLNSDASIYSYLLGDDNYRLIRANPNPNSSPKDKKYRLKKAIECLDILHNRKYITVPPINETFELKCGKKINIVVGNTSDTINLTYGERTGACMRIGGAGSSLFNFCLKNENGFHISFNDPNNNNLISRVSCYRNGNTVFLNQLRNSLDSNYTNEMVREACELIAKRIIDETKNSKYPVLNVVSSNCYAYFGSKTINSNCKNPTAGFHPNFYTDIGSDVVVVATSKDTLSPIELGPSKVEKYPVLRSSIKKYEGLKAINAVSHIEALDKYYSHIPIDDIEITEKNIQLAYVGEDWYVAIDNQNQIISYVQKNSNDPKKANEEMQAYLRIIEDTIKYSNFENIEKGNVK